MSNRNVAVNRPLVGLLAIGFLIAAGVLAVQIYWAKSVDGERWMMWLAAFVRVGLLLSAFWVALPSKKREAAWANISPWKFAGILLAIIAAGMRPRIVIPLLLVLIVVGLIIRPRTRHRPSRRV